ncbi:hypothetical protein CVT25_015831 [Psilocybe cyanescens]|uniref:Major facilitator superfamily (MFS) profile domain-containing protein n=1 Tax=Psilocybe cyanescens TaxID=93625 RepID=A0A409X542_PSICY|nr:hypothetical protein CVT25_015831 [Psilocybe cyanescens]
MDSTPEKSFSNEKHVEEAVIPPVPYGGAEKTLSRKQRLSPYFTIAAAAFGLISDGYQNNLMTMANVIFKKLYPKDYGSDVSTRVSNSLLVGAIIGQIVVGIICDRIGRKAALVITTALIVLGASLATAAHGANGSVVGLFWFLTFARGITGIGVGGEYPASSTSASEAANEKMINNRGPVFIMVTNFVLSFGGPLAVSVFLIVLSAAGEEHLQTVWRVCFGIGIALPLTVFYFRIRMLSSTLFQKGAIKRRVPYWLVFRRYWKSLIGTCGAWFLYDFITFPNGVFSGTIISNIIHDGDIKRTAEWQLLLGTIALPGVFVGLIIGLAYDKITKIIPLFVIFYGLMQSFGNLGPGDMLGLLPDLTLPQSGISHSLREIRKLNKLSRGTCYGLSAAVGKAGAAIGTQAFTPIQLHLGKKWTFIIAAICGTSGILVTYFFVPDMTGVDLADEDRKFMEYLTENGWLAVTMSVVLFRTHPHSSLAISSRHWLSHKCLHVSSPSTSSAPSATNSNNKPSVIKALGLTAAQTRKASKRIKRPEYKPTENLVKKHLLGLRDNPLTPKDVEALKPEKIADPKSLDYEIEYKKVLDSLMKAFTWPQLRQYLESTNSSPPSKGYKLATAEYIVEEKWGWTPLKQVLQDRVDWTEISEQHFSLDPGYSFLLVGKDGTELLKLSKRYNVQMSFINPRSLKVTGLKGALKQIEGYLESFKRDVETEDFSLPAEGNVTIPADRISRLSGAHVKANYGSKISISFLRSQPRAGDIARRLILQVIASENPSTRAIYKLENPENSSAKSPSSYSLYPFLPPQPLPWPKSSPSIFRYRRVGEWLKTSQPVKPETFFKEPADNHGMALLANGSEVDIKSHLLSQIGSIENGSPPPVFTVSFGHLLFLSPPNQRATLIPPLTGRVDANAVLRWISHSQDQVIFQPSVPSQVLSLSTHEDQNIRRLVYRTIKSVQTDDSVHGSSSPGLISTLTLELPALESGHEADDAPDSPVDLKRASFVKGIETSIDLFVPDGSADVKITASSIQSLPISSWSEELKNVAFSSQSEESESETDTSFPLMVTHDGVKFYFCNDTYVHRSLKKVTLEGIKNGRTIILETSIDHETGKSTTICKAVCEDHHSYSEWNDFLRICGLLTVPGPKVVAPQHLLNAYSPFRPFDK